MSIFHLVQSIVRDLAQKAVEGADRGFCVCCGAKMIKGPLYRYNATTGQPEYKSVCSRVPCGHYGENHTVTERGWFFSRCDTCHALLGED